jgi:hypothetical protein
MAISLLLCLLKTTACSKTKTLRKAKNKQEESIKAIASFIVRQQIHVVTPSCWSVLVFTQQTLLLDSNKFSSQFVGALF